MNVPRRHALGMMASALASGLPTMASAQAYPSKPISVIIPYPPGASTDQVGRMVQTRLAINNNVTVVAENRGGAGGNLGSAYVAKSPPDGYRILLATQPIVTINPFLYKDMGFDPDKDLTPLTCAVNAVVCLVVHPSFPVNTVAELIAYGKKNPGMVNYGTAGAGTPQHITGELLKGMAGIDIAHIPYKGAVLTDVMGGRVAMTLQNAGAILPMVREGKLRGLAVTSLMRSPNIPELPSIAESGFPGFEAISWFAIYAPAGTPVPIINKIYQESIKVVGNAEMKAKFAQLALDPYPRTGAETATIMKTDIEKWAKVIKDAGITMAE